MNQPEITTNPRRLAGAVVRLLDASEAAMTRGSREFAATYAMKAAEASARLHNTAMDRLTEVASRRITKLESQYGRLM